MGQTKYTFSGHDSFQCRLLWLKKGYDYLQAGRSFNADDAPVVLGVGNNMVRAIRFWLRAFGLLNETDEQPNELAHLLFGGTDAVPGCDPFLEDEATLWLLHYQLVRTNFASTYSLIFNELRKRKIEYTREDYVRYVEQKGREDNFPVNPKTVADDFAVFLRMYYRSATGSSDSAREREESLAGILAELELVSAFGRRTEGGKTETQVYVITPTERDDVPAAWLLYALLDAPELGLSINLDTLENDPGMPCAVFAMNRAGLRRKIEMLTAQHTYLTFNDQAGVRELQFRTKPADKYQILRDYYALIPAVV
jgi:hypothetical protein